MAASPSPIATRMLSNMDTPSPVALSMNTSLNTTDDDVLLGPRVTTPPSSSGRGVDESSMTGRDFERSLDAKIAEANGFVDGLIMQAGPSGGLSRSSSSSSPTPTSAFSNHGPSSLHHRTSGGTPSNNVMGDLDGSSFNVNQSPVAFPALGSTPPHATTQSAEVVSGGDYYAYDSTSGMVEVTEAVEDVEAVNAVESLAPVGVGQGVDVFNV